MKYFLASLFFLVLNGCDVSINTNESHKEALYNYNVEEKIRSLGIQLNEPGKPVANYVNAVRTGNLIFCAGKGPSNLDGTLIVGKVGVDLTVEEAYQAARSTALAQLGVLKQEIGDLNKVVRIVKVLGLVNAKDDFENQPEVINGFSDLMVEIFGERGKHARAAVGVASLPRNIVCEIEMIVEVQE